MFFLSCEEQTLSIPESQISNPEQQKVDEPDDEDPVKKITEKITECICEPYVSQFLWRDSTVVYVLRFKGVECSWAPTYYDKNGTKIWHGIGYRLDDFLKESTFVKLEWSCKEKI